MQRIPFIFSDQPKYRIARHLAFWAVIFLSQAAVSLVIPTFFRRNNGERFFEATYGQLLYLPAQIFLVYSLLYFVIPRFILKTKYKAAFGWTIFLCVVTGFIASLSYLLLVDQLASLYFGRGLHAERKGLNAYIPI